MTIEKGWKPKPKEKIELELGNLARNWYTPPPVLCKIPPKKRRKVNRPDNFIPSSVPFAENVNRYNINWDDVIEFVLKVMRREGSKYKVMPVTAIDKSWFPEYDVNVVKVRDTIYPQIPRFVREWLNRGYEVYLYEDRKLFLIRP